MADRDKDKIVFILDDGPMVDELERLYPSKKEAKKDGNQKNDIRRRVKSS